ncbi:hypothetical protein Dimus_005655 [Dionaea muscipula]
MFLMRKRMTWKKESQDMVLGDLFMDGPSSNEVLPPEILKSHKKEKARGLVSVKTLQTLENVWKKVVLFNVCLQGRSTCHAFVCFFRDDPPRPVIFLSMI